MAGDLTIANTLRDRIATVDEADATADAAVATMRDAAATLSNGAAISHPHRAPATEAAAGSRDGVARVHLRPWMVAVVAVDALAAGTTAACVLLVRIGMVATARYPQPLVSLVAAMVAVWLGAIALAGGYDTRHIPAGFEQYRRVITAAVWVLALAAFISFAVHADVSRALVLGSVPAATFLTIAGRYAVRKLLHRLLSANHATHRVLAVGLSDEVWQLVTHMNRAPFAGFRVVGAITPDDEGLAPLPPGVPWAGGDVRQALERARLLQADTIAVVATHLLPAGQLRRLSWDLEGTDIDLVLAPAITDVAGPRISMHPVAGLPLLCVEKPQFTGPRRLVKDALDRTFSVLALVVLLPVFAAIAVSVKVTSRGPVLYAQERIGIGGTRFRVLKFRSMRDGAHDERELLWHANEHDGPLFKMRKDPRLTPVGAFLRRWSLDELPQLWNVLWGDMSLVGPRPPLPSEVERYGADAQRRLLVKPGMTGLWQVSGRAELSWDESVRLDLHYVDNWSVGLDLVLLWKTLACVLRGQGAY